MMEHPVRVRRLAKGMSQTDLAKLTGMAREAIVRVEGGKTSRVRGIQRAKLTLLAQALEVDEETLGAEVAAWLANASVAV